MASSSEAILFSGEMSLIIFKKISVISVLLTSTLFLVACDSSTEEKTEKNKADKNSVSHKNSDVLPYLTLQEKTADIALPFCETKNCIDVAIQTVETQDIWLNQWIAKNQAKVIQAQVGLKQNMTLQQAVNAYVQKSDAWQAEDSEHKAYTLALYTRIAYQQNQFLLLQLSVDTQQEKVEVKERYYFFVIDRKKQQSVTLLDIIDEKQKLVMNDLVQEAYQTWRKAQALEIQQKAPEKLYWGQTDWFFDQEGIGLHYRANEIVENASQLDIYLTKEQTEKMLKPEIYQFLF